MAKNAIYMYVQRIEVFTGIVTRLLLLDRSVRKHEEKNGDCAPGPPLKNPGYAPG